MGKYYALNDGEAPEIAAALEEQYLPKSSGGRLPASDLGALVSLADKIDNVAAFFAVGQIPTGSEDPFALRRQAMGIVSILIDRGYEITLKEIFEKALSFLSGIKIKEGTSAAIAGFMEQRVDFILSSMGYEQDLVKALLPLSVKYPLKAIADRLEALKQFRDEEIYPDFLLAIKRVNNIIPKTALPEVREDLLVQDEEKALFMAYSGIREKAYAETAAADYTAGLRTLSGITSTVNSFFDRVLVMDKNEEIKNNRLALLSGIWSVALELADFSKLV